MNPKIVNAKDAKALCAELPAIQERLFRAGLLKTAHKMDEAVNQIGYEMAEYREQLQS